MNMALSQSEQLNITSLRNNDANYNSSEVGTHYEDKSSHLHGRKPLRIRFYANGDKFFAGKKISVHIHRYRNIEELMSELTHKMPAQVHLPSGIRQLFSPRSGRKITGVSQLENDHEYVCAGNETFKNVPYGNVDREPWFKGRRQNFNRVPPYVSIGFLGPTSQLPGNQRNEMVGIATNQGISNLYARYNKFPASRHHALGHHHRIRQQYPANTNTNNNNSTSKYARLVKLGGYNQFSQHFRAAPNNRYLTNNNGQMLLSHHNTNTSSDTHSNRRSQIISNANKPGVVTIVRHIPDNNKSSTLFIKMLLNKRNIQSFETLISDIDSSLTDQATSEHKAKMNMPVTKVFNIVGREIRSISDFFRNDDFFIVCSADESITDREVKEILDYMYPNHPQTGQILKYWTTSTSNKKKVQSQLPVVMEAESEPVKPVSKSTPTGQAPLSSVDKKDSGFEEQYDSNISKETEPQISSNIPNISKESDNQTPKLPKPTRKSSLSDSYPKQIRKKYKETSETNTDVSQEYSPKNQQQYQTNRNVVQHKNAERLKAASEEREKARQQMRQEIERQRKRGKIKDDSQKRADEREEDNEKSIEPIYDSPFTPNSDTGRNKPNSTPSSNPEYHASHKPKLPPGGRLPAIQHPSSNNEQKSEKPIQTQSLVLQPVTESVEESEEVQQPNVIEENVDNKSSSVNQINDDEIPEKEKTQPSQQIKAVPNNEVNVNEENNETEQTIDKPYQDSAPENNIVEKQVSAHQKDKSANDIHNNNNKIAEKSVHENTKEDQSHEPVQTTDPVISENEPKDEPDSQPIKTEIDQSSTDEVPITENLPGTRVMGKLCRQVPNSSIVYDRYTTSRLLGDGNFAVVKLATLKKQFKDNTDGDANKKREYALKIIDKSKMRGKESMIENEIWIMKLCKHPNIIELKEEYETREEVFLVTELIKGGDLFDAITQSVKFTEPIAARMVLDMASALFYLHSRRIVHRDLKPENLLVLRHKDGSITLKLADFGLAMEVKKLIFTVCGTPTYVAPEILTEKGYSIEVDLWALGVITYIILCGFPPFRSPNRDQEQLFELIKSGSFAFISPYWDTISSDVKDLIRRLLVVDRRNRYTTIDVLSHKWMLHHTSSSSTATPRTFRNQNSIPKNSEAAETHRKSIVEKLETQSQQNLDQFQKDKKSLRSSINKEIQQAYLNNNNNFATSSNRHNNNTRH